ncbi:hypothetical protein B0H17DRAFT_1201613 [Mycena rosella]|uniref:DUF6534 domain-containing protein n=1 Tax=Mycena rosella TaxID=1033263 RepID=A0AAD7GEB4_MYCRO|nr:hypothetical protein B0H17DRAFT_1201613 [Mycena rosella]
MSSCPQIPPLDNTLGAMVIGSAVATFLFGIGTLQTYHYYRLFPTDAAVVKWMVCVLWFLELGHTISTWHMMYSLTVTLYGQPQHIDSPPHSLEMTIFFSSLIYTIVQVFFANRIRALSGKWPITILCWIITVLRAICTLAMFGIILNVPLSDLAIKYRWIMITGLSLGVRDSGVTTTKRMVDRLLVWTIETGTATGGASMALLILFLVRNDLVWITFYLILAKLFSNSLLASLNGRQQFRGSRDVVNLNTGLGRATEPVTPQNRSMKFEMTTVTHSVPDFSLSKTLEAGKH